MTVILKRFLFLLAVVCCGAAMAQLSEEELKALPKERASWRHPLKGSCVDYSKALATAKRQKKYILVLKTGLDWCQYCSRAKKDVFDTRYFSQLLRQSFVLLNIDESRKGNGAEDQAKHNDIVLTAVGLKGHTCPYAAILDQDGKVLSTFDGNLGIQDFLAEMNKIANPQPEEQAKPAQPAASAEKTAIQIN